MKYVSVTSFVAGLIVGVLLAGAWFLNGNLAFVPSSIPSSRVATSSMPESTQSGAVSVSNQPAGDTVNIDSVTVPPPGVWVAVREVEARDGDLGNVLGAARVSGPRSSISVSLLRTTAPERSYAVELYRDDNNGAFDPAVNSVYVDFTTGAPVIAYFSTTD